MCKICHQEPCAPGCPNEKEETFNLYCDFCGEGIPEGTTYYEVGSYTICENCIADCKCFN